MIKCKGFEILALKSTTPTPMLLTIKGKECQGRKKGKTNIPNKPASQHARGLPKNQAWPRSHGLSVTIRSSGLAGELLSFGCWQSYCSVSFPNSLRWGPELCVFGYREELTKCTFFFICFPVCAQGSCILPWRAKPWTQLLLYFWIRKGLEVELLWNI